MNIIAIIIFILNRITKNIIIILIINNNIFSFIIIIRNFVTIYL